MFSADPRTVPDAARRLGVSRQAVQRLVDLLRDEGLVRAHRNPSHARSPLFSLTSAGKRTLGALTRTNEPWNERVSSVFEDADVERAELVLERIIELCDG